MNEILKEIARNIKNQDNRITEHPIFYVQTRVRVPAADGCGDFFAWYYEGEEIDEDLFESGEIKECDCDKFWYNLEYEDVQPFFTEVSARAFIDANSYHYNEPRVFVKNAWRNPEWQAIRKLLLEMEDA